MSGLKNKLPPSSKSFHHFEKKSIIGLENISNTLNRIEERLDSQRSFYERRLSELENNQEILKKQIYYYSEASMNDDKKSDFQMRCELFRRLPDATGVIRISQLATVKLMSELDSILRKNNIDYWFGYGSLLGAFIRKGPLPWDDDIDICLHRENLKKLIEILEHDDTYQITIVYDWYVKCIQYRFCPKNVKIPVFIDIGVWDYGVKRTDENEEKVQRIRFELMEELDRLKLPYWESRGVLPKPGSGFARQIGDDVFLEEWKDYNDKKIEKETSLIQNVFDKYVEKAKRNGLIVSRDKANSYIYSFDNLTIPNRRMIYEKKMIEPTIKIKYDRLSVSCPHDPKAFLDTCYNAWPYLPHDSSILGCSHSNSMLFRRPDIQEEIHKFIGKPLIK